MQEKDNNRIRLYIDINMNGRLLIIVVLLIVMVSHKVCSQVMVTGSTGADGTYATLKGAFDGINADAQDGNNITITLTSSTTETAPAMLSAGTWTGISIYPVASGLSISGNIAAPLIDLNGADNVTIDGRVNATGTAKDLIISNSSPSNTAGTSTIRFINSAENNSVKYCIIKGSETNTASGIIFFSTATSGNGNDNNSILNNDITNAASANRPVNTIYSAGSASYENSGIIVSNNNIFDFFMPGTSSYGVNMNARTTACTISGNSFFETTSFGPVAAVTYCAILINNASGNDFTVNNNYIGGSATECGGTSMSITSTSSHRFYGIYINAGISTASSVQGNIIRNISYSSISTSPWVGIYVNAGAVNVGTINGNTIGGTTGNNSVTLSNTSANAVSYGIYVNSQGNINIYNNNIGSITTIGSGSYSHSLYAIYKSLVGGNFTVNGNNIGSNTTSNSIQAVSPSVSASGQVVTAIGINGTGTNTITGNTIANMHNAYTGGSISCRTRGIDALRGANTILNNTIRGISSASGQLHYNVAASVIGISLSNSIDNFEQTIKGNIIYNLLNTNTTQTVHVYGIYFGGLNTVTNTITDNFIYNLFINTTNTASAIEGILTYSGSSVIKNNIISFGEGINTGISMYGIFDQGGTGNNNNIYFNTVYIGGTASGITGSTYALYSNANTSVRNYRNNLLYNGRTGGTTGRHYAIFLAGSTSLTIDYNNYFVSSAGTLGRIAGINYTALDASWRSATGGDVNSLNVNPVFMIGGSTSLNDYMPATTLAGQLIPEITLDILGVTRPGIPTIGAVERGPFWTGSTSTDFNTPSNWSNNVVPAVGANIFFADDPERSCVLDGNRTIGALVINQSVDHLIISGEQLTINGTLALTNGGHIDASAPSSTIVFSGTSTQTIPPGTFYNDIIYNLTVNNSNNVILNSDLRLIDKLDVISGFLDASSNSREISYEGETAQTIEDNQYLNGEIYDLVINNSDSLTINTDLTVDHNFTIQNGSYIEINAGKSLTVNGLAVNNAGTGGFVIQSGSTGTASLIHNTADLPATVRYFVNGNAEDWHFITSPVTDQAIEGSWIPDGTYGNGTGYDLYVWDEPEGCWVYKLNLTGNPNWPAIHPQVNFVRGKGYLYSVQETNPTKQFEGNLNNGDISIGLTSIGTDASLKGFNLIGNPYPSTIDWRAITGWNRSKLCTTGGGYDIWVWNPEANNYGVYNSADMDDIGTNSVSRYIAPMQGFFVKDSLPGNLVMTNSVRVNNVSRIFKSSNPENNNKIRLKIKSHAGYGVDEIMLQFGSSSNQPGANKLFSHNLSAPSLYLPYNGNNLSVLYLTDEVNNPSVPLSFQPGSEGSYSLHASFDPDFSVVFILEDRKNKSFHSFKSNNEYTFYASKNDDPNRFILHFTSSQAEKNKELPVVIYSSRDDIIIDLSLVDQKTSVKIMDILGRVIINDMVEGKAVHRIPIRQNNQIVIVFVYTSDASASGKFFLSD